MTTCYKCSLPIEGLCVPAWVDSLPYHSSCAPFNAQISYPSSAPAKQLTEADVRRIVREELAAVHKENLAKFKKLQDAAKEQP